MLTRGKTALRPRSLHVLDEKRENEKLVKTNSYHSRKSHSVFTFTLSTLMPATPLSSKRSESLTVASQNCCIVTAAKRQVHEIREIPLSAVFQG